MNPRDCFLAALRGGKADRVPLALEGFACATREKADAIEDPAAREIAHRVFDHVVVRRSCNSFVNRHFVTPPQFIREVDRKAADDTLTITSEIRTPKGPLTTVAQRNRQTDTVWTVKYPVESPADIDKIRSIPWELPAKLAPPDLSKLPENFREKCILSASVSSPFVCVAGMMSYESFLALCATDLALVEELTAECTDRVLAVLEVLLAPGTIEYVWMGGCEWLTPPMGSPRLYEKLVQEPEKRVIDRIHQSGALSHVHCHGKVRSTLKLTVQRGADYFEPVEPPPDGDVTFAEAKQIVAGRMTLGGNIEARILANQSADVVEKVTREAFEGGGHRMVLKATAGPIDRMTPGHLANYHRMIDVWEELSPL